jgi:heme/copper-type cytochrome/quinol oxidase subunit 2
MVEANTSEYKNVVHWFQMVIHAIPILIAIPLVIRHYLWKRKTAKPTQTQYAEESNKLIATTLQLLLFITIYLSVDTFVSLHSIDRNSEAIIDNTEKILAKEETANLFTNGTDGIYVKVEEEFKQRKDFESVLVIDIMGYTLFSVEPKIPFWKGKGYLRNVEINLFHIDKNFIKTTRYIDPSWENKLESFVKSIEEFRRNNEKFLKENNVKINLYSYSYIPSLHGFRFKGGTYFISCSSWEESRDIIRMPNEDTFFVIDRTDTNKPSLVLKDWFDNRINAILRQNGVYKK